MTNFPVLTVGIVCPDGCNIWAFLQLRLFHYSDELVRFSRAEPIFRAINYTNLEWGTFEYLITITKAEYKLLLNILGFGIATVTSIWWWAVEFQRISLWCYEVYLWAALNHIFGFHLWRFKSYWIAIWGIPPRNVSLIGNQSTILLVCTFHLLLLIREPSGRLFYARGIHTARQNNRFPPLVPSPGWLHSIQRWIVLFSLFLFIHLYRLRYLLHNGTRAPLCLIARFDL